MKKVACVECHNGLMQIAENPPSGDYDENGILEPFCNDCGSGFRHFLNGIPFFSISKRKIRLVVDKVFTRNGLLYNNKKEVEDKIFETCRTRVEIIAILHEDCGEDIDFLKEMLI